MTNITRDIIQQLGGNRFFIMTGCKAITDDRHDAVHFTIPRNASKANRFTVTYDSGLDLYRVRFTRFTSAYVKNGRFYDAKETEVYSAEDVFFDQLQDIFHQVTGMHTHL